VSSAEEIAPDVSQLPGEPPGPADVPAIDAMSDDQIRARFGRITFRELRALPAEHQERVAQVVAPRVGQHLVEALRPAPGHPAGPTTGRTAPVIVRFSRLPPAPAPPTAELDVSAVLDAIAEHETQRRRACRRRRGIRAGIVAGVEAAGIGGAVPLLQLTPVVTAEISGAAAAVAVLVALPWDWLRRR
jgi:hypothetical protein